MSELDFQEELLKAFHDLLASREEFKRALRQAVDEFQQDLTLWLNEYDGDS